MDQLIGAAIRNAKAAIATEGRNDVKVALDLGPLGEMLEPMGTLTFDGAYELFRESVIAGERHGADLVVFETFSDLLELKAGLLAARENTSLPVFCTMTFTESGKTFAGVSVASAAVALTALGASAVGINCSLGPVQIYPMIQEMARYTDLPLIVKANAGLPKDGAAVYDIGPEVFAEMAPKFVEAGTRYIGGCCGTTPAYIAAIHGAVEGLSLPPARTVPTAVWQRAGDGDARTDARRRRADQPQRQRRVRRRAARGQYRLCAGPCICAGKCGYSRREHFPSRAGRTCRHG